jgi:hypothetical protein
MHFILHFHQLGPGKRQIARFSHGFKFAGKGGCAGCGKIAQGSSERVPHAFHSCSVFARNGFLSILNLSRILPAEYCHQLRKENPIPIDPLQQLGTVVQSYRTGTGSRKASIPM